MTKIVKMVCPSCGHSYPEKEEKPIIDVSTGKLTTLTVHNKKCESCQTGLVRQVVKLDKKGKIR
jgi:rubredoxin